MKTTTAEKTISQVFEEFLADQKARISHKTYLKYQSIISLYKSYLESYWPGHDGEYDKITKAGGTFCGTFGARRCHGRLQRVPRLLHAEEGDVRQGNDAGRWDGHEEAGEVAGREGLCRRTPRTPRSERVKQQRICPTPSEFSICSNGYLRMARP